MIVKLLFGHICAGKSTHAIRLLTKNNHIRLSMDDLKIMMFNHIPSDKQTEDIVSATIEHMCNLINGIDDYNRDVVIDGFPLDLEAIRYMISCFTVEITVFTIDLFKANMRNRKRYDEDGIFIEPEEIKRYNEDFDKFIKSKEFQEITKGTPISYIYNYEKNRNCFVM